MSRYLWSTLAVLAFGLQTQAYVVTFTLSADAGRYCVWAATDAPGGIVHLSVSVFARQGVVLNDDQQLQLPVFRTWVTDEVNYDTGELLPPHWRGDRGFFIARLDCDEVEGWPSDNTVSSRQYGNGYQAAASQWFQDGRESRLCRQVGRVARTYSASGYPSQTTAVPVLVLTGSYTGSGYLHVAGTAGVFDGLTSYTTSNTQSVGDDLYVTPEPVTLSLVCAGTLAIAARRRPA